MRPLSIGEIYDGSIRAIRANPRTMVGFSAIIGAIIIALGTVPQLLALNDLFSNPLLTSDAETLDTMDWDSFYDLFGVLGVTLLVSLVQSVLSTTIITGMLIVAVGGAVRGETLSPGQLWQRARHRLWSVLGLALLMVLVAPLFIGLCLVPGGLLTWAGISGDSDGLLIAGVIALLAGGLAGALTYAVFYLGFWSVAAPALLLENLGVVAALRRSARLVRGSFWRVFGISLLTMVIASVITQIFGVPFQLIGNVVSLSGDLDLGTSLFVQQIFTDVGTILAGAVVYPFSAGAIALLYLDLRMRREGMDVEMLRSEQPR
ncbi:hypothetical protein [Kineosporia sp. NBRC 101731]|uniref:DUF7847 domain-containing protein n=1 Tax=Kineosporia sp. NBRC 101731 TaxID=3032199 RepID=UPI0024A5DE36|nr:hypothetical protein [Kineosporia sp. NBRC 101731]GLY28432.1 hypothetical protein Kisp02_17970 [Kineosporia sp. NBRC 101731]